MSSYAIVYKLGTVCRLTIVLNSLKTVNKKEKKQQLSPCCTNIFFVSSFFIVTFQQPLSILRTSIETFTSFCRSFSHCFTENYIKKINDEMCSLNGISSFQRVSRCVKLMSHCKNSHRVVDTIFSSRNLISFMHSNVINFFPLTIS